MGDEFSRSIERGKADGIRMAELDAVVAEAQVKFLALCREFRDLAHGLGSEDARFDLSGIYGNGGGKVVVSGDGSVSLQDRCVMPPADLDGPPQAFGRTMAGPYESRPVDEVRAILEGILNLSTHAMAGVLREMAAHKVRYGEQGQQ